MLFPSAFGRMCSNTGFTCSTFCASAGETPNAIAVNTSPKKAVCNILVIICLTSFLEIFSMRSFRSASLCGIREGRCGNQVAGVWTLVTGDKTFTDTGVHGTDRGGGLVCKAFEIFLEEALLEAYTRVPGHNFFV